MSNPVLASIDLGVSLASSEVTVYFAKDGEKFDVALNQGDWSAYEQAMAMAALDAWAAVADLSFAVTDDPEGATFRLTKAAAEHGSLGFMNPPDPDYGNSQGIGWFNTYFYWDGEGMLDPGSYTYTIFLHEFGHGLGLGHPHDDYPEKPAMPQVGEGMGLDQGVYTVMTYNDGWPEAPEGGARKPGLGWNLGPSAIDIAVVQEKYGANTTTGAGKTRYVLADENEAGTGYLTIWDVGGTDTIAYSGARDAVIDLRAATLEAAPGGGGWVSHAAGVHGGFTIAHGVVIERAPGGSGEDRITGNDSANVLSGRAGADRLAGGKGADTLKGGAGTDRLVGGAGADVLEGGAGADRMIGGGGADVLTGGGGRDTLTGGKGADTFVIVPGGGRDRITDFEARDVLDLTAFGLAGLDAVAVSDQGESLRLDLDRAVVILRGLAGAELTGDMVLI